MNMADKLEEDRRKFDEEFEEELINTLTNAISWNDIPVWLFEACKRKGLLNISQSEQDGYDTQAIEIERQELESELKSTIVKYRKLEIKFILNDFKGTLRSKVIAKKIALFENRNQFIKS